MQAIGQIHRADAGTIDFIHMMGSMSCILNAGAGAGLYEQLTQDPETGYSHDKNGHLKVAPGNANRAPEAATWGGDIASGKMGSADMNADMDAINLNDLIKRNPGRNPMELMNQYYQNVAKDPSYRADQFCQHYDPDGTRDPDKGYQWLQDNGYHLSTAPLGDKGLAVLNQATPSKQSDAFDQFMDSIDQQRHQ
ncbi:hypothetical protein [Bifidobacterium bombi]|uniref:hypothetical protein n=1 Tax=Bifidobacterium bombi TaxID=471511 RepID=UPI0005C6A20A|nr:hypothetical protein [Bifidobacterium bombi]